MKHIDYDDILQSIRYLCASEKSTENILYEVCVLLKSNINHYDWVGFYLTDSDAAKVLVLGPYAGTPTEHTRIPYGKGICGQAANIGQTFVVQDVSLETNYLSCSPDVRAEIVSPIFKNGVVVGEIDIDSHHLAPFTEEDQHFLTEVCNIVSILI